MMLATQFIDSGVKNSLILIISLTQLLNFESDSDDNKMSIKCSILHILTG